MADFLDSALRQGTLNNLHGSNRPELTDTTHSSLKNSSLETSTTKPEYQLSSYEKRIISRYNKLLIDKIKYLDPSMGLPDGLRFESHASLFRLHTEKSHAYKKSDHPAEFLYYPKGLPSELGEVFGEDVQSILVVGIYTDPPTRVKYQSELRDMIPGYFPQTWYGIQMHGIDQNNLALTKVSAIPHIFNDPRPNLFPEIQDAHYVRSQLLSSEGDIVPAVLSHMVSQL